jgi:hypothetical protein
MGSASRAAAVVHQVISDARAASAFLKGHRPVPWMLTALTTCIYVASQSPHGTASDRPIPQSSYTDTEFSEKFGILEKQHVSNDATENAWFLNNLICLPGNGPY